MKIKTSAEIEYNPTVQELAEEIWALDAKTQCELINELGRVGDGYRIIQQFSNIENVDYCLDSDGEFFCRKFSEYLTR